MKKYIIRWDSVRMLPVNGTILELKPKIREIEAEDVQFKDFYVKATDDDTGEKLYIPYQRIYDIKQIGETEL